MLFALCPTLMWRCLYPGNKGCPTSSCLHFFLSSPPISCPSLINVHQLGLFFSLPVRTSPSVSTLSNLLDTSCSPSLSVGSCPITYFRDTHVSILCSSWLFLPASILRSSLKDFSTSLPNELMMLCVINGVIGRFEQHSLHPHVPLRSPITGLS